MDRRQFIKTSSAAGALTLLPLSCMTTGTQPKFKLGYQLYSIRDEMEKDAVATLKALKAMGYQDFEHYGFNPDDDSYYGFPVEDFKSILDDLDLSISSGHYPFSDFFLKAEDDLKRYLDQCIQGALTMNSNYITWPWMAPEYRNLDGYKRLATKLNLMGEQVTKAGLGFAYHNHGYEFEEHQGTSGYDIITKETDPDLVKLQLDMYWIMHEGKTTPKALINAHPGRIVMWHIKDMHKESRDYTELGNGSIDYTDILPDPLLSGLEFYYIEQGGNYTENSMKSAAFSADYLKRNLQKYL